MGTVRRSRAARCALCLVVAASLLVPEAPIAAAAGASRGGDQAATSSKRVNAVPLYVAQPVAPVTVGAEGGGPIAAGGIGKRQEPAPEPNRGTPRDVPVGEFTTITEKADGTYAASISVGRLNYRDGTGEWRPIDVRLVDDAAGSYAVRTKANDVTVRGSADLGADRVVELAAGDQRVRIRVPGLANGLISSKRDRIEFEADSDLNAWQLA